MTALWALVAGPAMAAPTVQLTKARGIKASFKLTDSSSLTFTIDGRHPQALGLVELATDVHLLRNGKPLFTGRLGATTDELDDASHTTSCTVGDTRALLARRLVQMARSYAGIDIAVVTRDLMIDAQTGAGGGLGIAIPDVATTAAGLTGITVTRDMADGAKVFDELQTVAGKTNDSAAQVFDWDITPGWTDRQFQLFAPARGSNKGVTLDYIYNNVDAQTSVVQKVGRALDPKDYANVVHASGGVHTETHTENQTVTETRTRVVPVVATTTTGAAASTTSGSAATVTRGTRTVATSGRDMLVSTQLTDAGLVASPQIVDNPSTSNPTYATTTETYEVTYSTQVQVSVEVPNTPVTYDNGTTVWQFGIIASALSFPDVTSAEELQATAQQNLAELQQVAPTITLTLKSGWWQGPDHVWLGDTIRLRIRSGRLVDDLDLRVTQIDLDIGDDGVEQVTFTVGPNTSLLSVLIDQAKRIATLERQVSL